MNNKEKAIELLEKWKIEVDEYRKIGSTTADGMLATVAFYSHIEPIISLLRQPECKTCGDKGYICDDEDLGGDGVTHSVCPDCQPARNEEKFKGYTGQVGVYPHQSSEGEIAEFAKKVKQKFYSGKWIDETTGKETPDEWIYLYSALTYIEQLQAEIERLKIRIKSARDHIRTGELEIAIERLEQALKGGEKCPQK